MTFLCTIAGDLVSRPRPPWPWPWALRCDECGAVKPYMCVAIKSEMPGTDQVYQVAYDRHRCRACHVGSEQLGMFR